MNLRGIWQAAYTAGVGLPKPVATCQYWHRSLNPKKLIDIGFSRLQVHLMQTGSHFSVLPQLIVQLKDAHTDVWRISLHPCCQMYMHAAGCCGQSVTQMYHPAGAHDHGTHDQAVQAA